MPIRKLIVQHGPRFTTIALATVHQEPFATFLEERGIALMLRKSSASSRFSSLKVCCTSKVARDLFDEWAERATGDLDAVAPPCSRSYFYISAQNQVEGPFDFGKMSDLLFHQAISGETLTAAEGETSWTPLKATPELGVEEARLSALIKVSGHTRNGLAKNQGDTAMIGGPVDPSPSFTKLIGDFAKTSLPAKSSIWKSLLEKKPRTGP